MSNSIPTQLRFSPFAGFTVRADFEGEALSSDFGPLLLRGVDQQIGLTHRLSQAMGDRRHASYIDHSMEDLLTQRIFQIACGYADANDANALRRGPVFKLGAERLPLEADQELASAPTFSRLENAASNSGPLPYGQGLCRAVCGQLRQASRDDRAGHGSLRRPDSRPTGTSGL